MRRVLLLLTASLVLVASAFAQERTVTGKVTSADDGSALPGVNVVLKGTTAGTVTDVDGNYKISVPAEGGTLVFSFIGLTTSEIGIGSRQTVDVQMAADVTQLSEIVVVGYGSTLKKELTSSIASLGAEEIAKLPSLNAQQALQGLTSGVMVTSNSGTPGGGISVRVRGQTSINASNEPLYVIDGVVLATGGLNQNAFGGQSDNILANLNPQDIESMQVLKDASSTAIYGARAANGVVLITTKRGKQDKGQINVSAWTGWSEPTNYPEQLSASEYITIKQEAHQNDNPGAPPLTNTFLGWDGTTDTDWMKEIFRTARTSEYQLNSQGGTNKISYYLSGSYRDEEGTIIGSGFNRYTGRVNLDYNATDKLKVGTSLALSSSLSKRIGNDNYIYGVFSSAILTPSTKGIRDENGNFIDALPSFLTNPVRDAIQPRYDNTTNKFTGNLNVSYSIIDNLTFRTDVSYDRTSFREDHYEPATTAMARSVNGRGRYSTSESNIFLIEPTLRYAKTFNNHKLDAIIGASLQESKTFSNSVIGTGYARPTLTYITDAATIADGDSFLSEYNFASNFGRINYSFKEKYLASVSVRRDGSSRFGPENLYGLFWAVSGGWNFADESFFDGLEFVEIGKLRASYGVTGNDRIGNFQYLGAWTGGANYLDQSASAPSRIANPLLKWEETTKLDIGVDLGLFNSRVNVSATYYRAETNDLLFANPIPLTSGFASVQDNIGNIFNEGFELELGGQVLSSGGFTWDVRLNNTWQRNEVVDIKAEAPLERGFASAIIKGEPLGTFFGLKWLGVNPATGNSVFQDTNNDGAITSSDRVVIGDAMPDMIGGITSTMNFKGFSLDVFFQYVYGTDIYNNTATFNNNPSAGWSMSNRMLDRWQKPGDITYVPKATLLSTIDYSEDNSRWLSDGSYMRLKNIVLSYNLPKQWIQKAKLNSVRVYAQGQNLLTFTNYTGADPEVSTFGDVNTSQGTDFLTFPQARMYSVGINVGF
jgi:TonB-linked SusC/RagA family outer membrane protein